MSETSISLLELAMYQLETGDFDARGVGPLRIVTEVWKNEKHGEDFSQACLDELARVTTSAVLHLVSRGVKLP